MRKAIFLLFLCINAFAQTGIGTTTPNASAKLDVYSTNKGFLPPRVTIASTTDATTIASPAEGLLVYNLGSVGLQAGYYYWNGANWATIATATSAGNGVTASDMVKLYGEVHSSAAGKISSSTGYVFTVPVSGRYLFDFTSAGTALQGGTTTFYFQVRQGTTVLGTDSQSSYNNNVHVEYNGKVEVNLQAGVSYNVYTYATSGSFEANDYDRVYYKLVAGNLPVTGQSVEYGIARYTGADGSVISDNAIVPFDASAAGNLTWSANKFTLKANKTYELESSLAIYVSGGSGIAGRFQIYDYTNSIALANGLFMSQNGAGSSGQNANSPMKGIVTPTSDIQVGIRLLDHYGPNGPSIVGSTSVTGSSSAANASYFLVKQIGSSAIVDPWVLSGINTYNTTGNVGIGNNAPTAALDVTGTGKFSSSIINSGNRTYLGKDGASMHWLATTDAVTEPNNLAYGFESNGSSIQSHKWYTAGTEKMKLINTGKLGIGTSTPGTSFHIENGNSFGTDPSNTSSPSLLIFNNNNASSTAHASGMIRTAGISSGKPYLGLDVMGQFGYSIGVNNPTDQMILNTSWNFTTSSAGNNAIIINRSGQTRVAIPEQGGAYSTDWTSGWGGGLSSYDMIAQSIKASNFVTRSDKRLKNTILTIDSLATTKFLNLRPVTFYWNQDKPRDPNLQYGLIAQEVELLFPELVNSGVDSMQTKSVNYQALHALSLKVIQNQQTEIEDLKKQNLEFEKRLLLLESKIK